jgi:pimeloyl-ACP methyl ester carboxylesterase
MSAQQPDWEEFTKDTLFRLAHTERRNQRAVLFVHGILGDPDGTWRAKGARQSFPDLIFSDPQLQDYDVFRFEYRTSLTGGDAINDVAKQLHAQIANEDLDQYRWVLLAHSMGGLVCMRYILNQVSRGDTPPVLGLVLYGTPMSGSEFVWIAELASWTLDFIIPGVGSMLKYLLGQHRQVQQLAAASEFIQQLGAEWALRVANGGHYSEEPERRAILPLRVVTGTKDGVVSEESAKGTYGEIDWLPMPYDHRGLVKPSTRNDQRYQAAREFLRVCRAAKSPEVQLGCRKVIDSVWKASHGRVISRWKYEVHIHGGHNSSIDAELLEAGFSPCSVKTCSYRTVLDTSEVPIGLTYGSSDDGQSWEAEPFYVHELVVDEYPESEERILARAIEKVLANDSNEKCWETLFPVIKVSVAEGEHALRYDLIPGKATPTEDRLVRNYVLPKEASFLQGQEVLFELSYDSVVPRSLNVFRLFAPWLTYRCEALIIVHDAVRFVGRNQRVFGDRPMHVDAKSRGIKGKATARTEGLLLPKSLVEFRWQRIAQEQEKAS